MEYFFQVVADDVRDQRRQVFAGGCVGEGQGSLFGMQWNRATGDFGCRTALLWGGILGKILLPAVLEVI